MRKSIPWGTNHALSVVDSLFAFKMKPCSSTFSLSPSISSFRMLSASQPLQTSRMLLQAVKPLIAAFMLESECSWHGDVSGSHGTEPNLRISPKRGAPYLEFLLLAGGTARWRNGACCGEPGTEKCHSIIHHSPVRIPYLTSDTLIPYSVLSHRPLHCPFKFFWLYSQFGLNPNIHCI